MHQMSVMRTCVSRLTADVYQRHRRLTGVCALSVDQGRHVNEVRIPPSLYYILEYGDSSLI